MVGFRTVSWPTPLVPASTWYHEAESPSASLSPSNGRILTERSGLDGVCDLSAARSAWERLTSSPHLCHNTSNHHMSTECFDAMLLGRQLSSAEVRLWERRVVWRSLAGLEELHVGLD